MKIVVIVVTAAAGTAPRNPVPSTQSSEPRTQNPEEWPHQALLIWLYDMAYEF